MDSREMKYKYDHVEGLGVCTMLTACLT
jgi:hypothetical protein